MEQEHNHHICVFASLLGQVREKKDVPLGPEDPKEEDGSFDYRWVIRLAHGPHPTMHPVVTSASLTAPPCPECTRQGCIPTGRTFLAHLHGFEGQVPQLKFIEFLRCVFHLFPLKADTGNAIAVK